MSDDDSDDWDEEIDDDPTVQADDDEPEFVECPNCRKFISEEAEQCPYCRHYLSTEDATQRPAPWLFLIVLLLVIAVISWALH